jgi:quinolinate synthase
MTGSEDSIVRKIEDLKKKRNAVLLVHNYQLGEVQDIADFSGDSLELSRQAAGTDADVIVFCGVHFMAETAAILCPDKTVLLPDLDAGCPMADMITADQLRRKKGSTGREGDLLFQFYRRGQAESVSAALPPTRRNRKKISDAERYLRPRPVLGDYAARQQPRTDSRPGYCPTLPGYAADIYCNESGVSEAKTIVLRSDARSERGCRCRLSTGGKNRFARETDAKK